MKLARLPHDPAALVEFFQEGLESLGAICERTWHDRLQLVAEGAAARLWHPEGQLLETEIHFPPAGDSAPRQAATEVFPGCPLTFHLAEALRSPTLCLQRAVLRSEDNSKPPAPDVAEKLWHLQSAGTTRWKLEAPFKRAWHFSLLVLARCEVQAIDQHWSLHRWALSLPEGQCDEPLARSLDFYQLAQDTPAPITWPRVEATAWRQLLRDAVTDELETDLAAIRRRQENYLRRELDRIDDYFANYERELSQRLKPRQRGQANLKAEERVAAAKIEHARRRQDQVQRHEIRVIPHLDALLVLAEPAWQTTVSFARKNEAHTQEALFVPRARRWVLSGP